MEAGEEHAVDVCLVDAVGTIQGGWDIGQIKHTMQVTIVLVRGVGVEAQRWRSARHGKLSRDEKGEEREREDRRRHTRTCLRDPGGEAGKWRCWTKP